MSFKATTTVLEELREKIATLTWTPEGGSPEPAFDKVVLFDVSDLEAAIEELFAFKSRLCVIVVESERFTNEGQGATKLRTRQVRSVSLIISDRYHGKRKFALTGAENSPGVLKLKDVVLDGVLGFLVQGVFVQPTFGASLPLRDEKREDLAGRVVYELDLELIGGFQENTISTTGPVL